MKYIKISEVDTVDNGFIIEFEEALGHYIYVTPNPPNSEGQPDKSLVDFASDDDDQIIWF